MGSGGLDVVPEAGVVYRVLQQQATDPTAAAAVPSYGMRLPLTVPSQRATPPAS